MVQWLRVCIPMQGGPGSISSQGTRPCMPQQRSKILGAATKIQGRQINMDGAGVEGGSGWGTHVHPWWIHVNVWQNQYNIVK